MIEAIAKLAKMESLTEAEASFAFEETLEKAGAMFKAIEMAEDM